MSTIELDTLSRVILRGPGDAALLIGVSWEELRPDDRCCRFTLVIDEPKGREIPRAFDVVMHRITRLVGENGILAPGDVDLDLTKFTLEGETYMILNRTCASWQFLRDTHNF